MIKRYRHAQLLAVLSVLLLANPFLQGALVVTVVDVVFGLTLISAVIASANTRWQLWVGVTLVVLVQGLAWWREYTGHLGITAASAALALVFFSYVTAIALIDVFRSSKVVSADTICGALSAYILIGVAFSFAFALVDVFEPGSFEGLREGVGKGYQRYLGYSFVTLTTLGYGNVVPLTSRAEAIAVAEAVVGQVYLTVLVARLVALNLTSSANKD